LLNTHYVLLPIPTLISQPRVVNTAGRKWNRLLTAIEQPNFTPGGAVAELENDGAVPAKELAEPVAT
jgi:hypothetical protein